MERQTHRLSRSECDARRSARRVRFAIGISISNLATGQSLVRPQVAPETLYMSTSTAVWEADDPKYGAVFGNRVIVTSEAGNWDCYLLGTDPREVDVATGIRMW